jgi:hypothetical protein
MNCYKRLLAQMACLGLLLSLTGSAAAQSLSRAREGQITPKISRRTAPRGTLSAPLKTHGFAWALSGFKLAVSGDSKLRRLGVSLNNNRFRAAAADHDGKEGFNVDAQWRYAFSRQVHVAKRARCRGTCTIAIKRQPGKVFVLSGFDLNRRGGDDNVQELAIVPNDTRGQVSVTFRDRSGKREFDARIEYLLLPKNRVFGTHRQAWKYRRRNLKPNLKTKLIGLKQSQPCKRRGRKPAYCRIWARHVLRGFRVRFSNGDHHFGGLSVRVGKKAEVRLRDRNSDDPSDVEVHYALIDDPTMPEAARLR